MYAAAMVSETMLDGVFLDDPLVTHGSVAAFVLDSEGDSYSTALDLTGLAPGVHTFYMRFNDGQVLENAGERKGLQLRGTRDL